MDQAALARRYGDRWDFARLSKRQRALLSDSRIADNKSVAGFHTVDIDGIRPEDGSTVLTLHDTFSYTFGRNRVNAFEYSRRRLPEYKAVLGIEGLPLERRDHTYLFDLQEGKIVVIFGSVKETV